MDALTKLLKQIGQVNKATMKEGDHLIAYNTVTTEINVKKIISVETEETSPGWLILILDDDVKVYLESTETNVLRENILYMKPGTKLKEVVDKI